MQVRLDFSHSVAGEKLAQYGKLWQAVPHIVRIVEELSKTLDLAQYEVLEEGVYVHKSAHISPSAQICAPCIICAGAQIRHCAYIRGSAIIGENCVVGNSTEIKNAVLFDGVQVPHFNYVGDSILGYKAHLGAGVILSNVRSDKACVCVDGDGARVRTGLKKLGSIIGDFAEIGCNSVLAPGAQIGAEAVVYPLSFVRGVVPEGCIYRQNGLITVKKRI